MGSEMCIRDRYKVADAERLGSLRLPTPEIDRIVAGMNHNNSRIQVVDFSGRVLLTVGDIQSATGLQLAKSTSDNEENKYWELLQSQIFLIDRLKMFEKPYKGFVKN